MPVILSCSACDQLDYWKSCMKPATSWQFVISDVADFKLQRYSRLCYSEFLSNNHCNGLTITAPAKHYNIHKFTHWVVVVNFFKKNTSFCDSFSPTWLIPVYAAVLYCNTQVQYAVMLSYSRFQHFDHSYQCKTLQQIAGKFCKIDSVIDEISGTDAHTNVTKHNVVFLSFEVCSHRTEHHRKTNHL